MAEGQLSAEALEQVTQNVEQTMMNQQAQLREIAGKKHVGAATRPPTSEQTHITELHRRGNPKHSEHRSYLEERHKRKESLDSQAD